MWSHAALTALWTSAAAASLLAGWGVQLWVAARGVAAGNQGWPHGTSRGMLAGWLTTELPLMAFLVGTTAWVDPLSW